MPSIFLKENKKIIYSEPNMNELALDYILKLLYKNLLYVLQYIAIIFSLGVITHFISSISCTHHHNKIIILLQLLMATILRVTTSYQAHPGTLCYYFTQTTIPSGEYHHQHSR